MNINYVWIGLVLLINSYFDIRFKQVKLSIIIVGGIIIGISNWFIGIEVLNSVLGMLVGVMMMGISKVTREQIGMGDGVLLCVTGFGLGFLKNCELLLLALTIASVVSMVLLLFRKVGRKYKLPMVPFLFLGFIGVILL